MLSHCRRLILLLAVLGLVACQSSPDAEYYRSHPEKIAQAMKHCQSQAADLPACQQLEVVQQEVMALAFELQSSPQAFGKKILQTQESIAAITTELKQAESKKDRQKIASLLARRKAQQLDEHRYLAVVRWLESPEG